MFASACLLRIQLPHCCFKCCQRVLSRVEEGGRVGWSRKMMRGRCRPLLGGGSKDMHWREDGGAWLSRCEKVLG